jgi:hypothetical protein
MEFCFGNKEVITIFNSDITTYCHVLTECLYQEQEMTSVLVFSDGDVGKMDPDISRRRCLKIIQ